MNQYTDKELNELDDITFVMCLLSELRGKMNKDATLALKLSRAYQLLDNIRGNSPLSLLANENDIWPVLRERIYREVEHEYWVEDVAERLDSQQEYLDLGDLTADEIIEDSKIMVRIYERFTKYGCGDDYWDNIDEAINEGIKTELKARGCIGN